MQQTRLNHYSLQFQTEVIPSPLSHCTTSPIIFTHPAPSTTTIGEAGHSHLFFAMRQGDEEIPLEELSQPPLAHLKDRVERELPQDMC